MWRLWPIKGANYVIDTVVHAHEQKRHEVIPNTMIVLAHNANEAAPAVKAYRTDNAALKCMQGWRHSSKDENMEFSTNLTCHAELCTECFCPAANVRVNILCKIFGFLLLSDSQPMHAKWANVVLRVLRSFEAFVPRGIHGHERDARNLHIRHGGTVMGASWAQSVVML